MGEQKSRVKKAAEEGTKREKAAEKAAEKTANIDERQLEETAQAARLLADWYRRTGRELPWRKDKDAYKIWISEIMLQQTRIEAVKPYYARFMEELPDMASLARVPEERLLKLWEGLGYYSRARNLKKCAVQVMEEYGGSLPADYNALLKLPGIGPYTAGAIASIAYGQAVPAVDGNVLRVLARFLADREDISQPAVRKRAWTLLSAAMPKDCPGEFNEGIMELGETVCLPGGRPLCEKCPLEKLCRGRRQGMEEELPVKAAPKPRRTEERTILILQRETADGCRQTAIRRRPGKGLLAGLFELPSLDGFIGEEGVRRYLAEQGLSPLRIEKAGQARHVFSHVEWDMEGYLIELAAAKEAAGAGTAGEEAGGFLYVDSRQLRDRYALPSGFRAYRKWIL